MFLSELMSVEKALKIIKNVEIGFYNEKIGLKDAYNRVIAENVKSLLDSPPFDKSAMDGYAIKAEDTFGFSETNPAYLKIVDRISAGQLSNVNLKNGEAVQIATGTPIPEGANAVVMEEYTHAKSNDLEVATTLTPGENISFRGEDIKKGELVLNTGKLLRPQDLAIMASAGHDKIRVYKKPVVNVITTGNELVKPTSRLQGGQIINSNYYTLKSLVESCLAVPELSHCIDDHNLMKEQLKRSLKASDVIITTGGTAISKGDVVVDVVGEMGEILIHGVSIRPGKPFAFGIIDKKPVFMLSGYPVAAMVQFDVFIRSYLMQMQNIDWKPAPVSKIASKKIPSTLGRMDYVRGKIEGEVVHPQMIKGSGVMRSMVKSDCYIIIEENLEGIDEGESCDVLMYDRLKV